MAFGAVFVPTLEEPYYDFVLVEYKASRSLGEAKTRKDGQALHDAYRNQYNANAHILEISRMAEGPGCLLSTKYARMEYLFRTPYKRKRNVYIETVYHGSKCFESGGPFEDLISSFKTPYSARTDYRLKTSGKLKNFHYDEITYPSYPAESAFFDWLYLRALQGNSDICNMASQLFEYDAFTDMDFNPVTQKCIVCPARVAAMYVGMTKAGVLTDPVDFRMVATLDNMMLEADIHTNDQNVTMLLAPSDDDVEIVLDHPPVELSMGEKLTNKFWGEGTVCEITETGLKVDFGTKGVRTFLNPDAFEKGFLRKVL